MSGQIGPLTSLRFFAALIVVLFHFAPFMAYPPGLRQLAGMGPTGVAFFFVLSGFILTYTYLWKFRGTSDPVGITRTFLQARVARVYPLYVLALLLITPLTLWTLAHTPGVFARPVLPGELLPSWLRELLLVQVYIDGSQSLWNAPGWSIACEALFYLSFPLIALGLLRVRPGVNLLAVALGLAAVQVVTHVLLVRAHLGGAAWAGEFAYSSPFVRLFEFMIGCVVGAAFLRGQAGDTRYQLGARGRLVTLAVAGAVILVGMAFKALLPQGSEDLVTRVLGQTMHDYAAYTLPFAALIFAYASGPTVGSRLLSSPTLVLLGEASYSLYILHWTGYRGLDALKNSGFSVPPWAAWLTVLGLVGVSVLSLRLVELPLRDRLRPRRAVPRAALLTSDD